MNARQWAMILHFSMLLNVPAPVVGLVAPIIIWQLKKSEFPEIDAHGKVAVNWILSALIYGIVCLPFTLILIGVPMLFALYAVCIIFPLIGGIKANDGEVWKYPLSILFFK